MGFLLVFLMPLAGFAQYPSPMAQRLEEMREQREEALERSERRREWREEQAERANERALELERENRDFYRHRHQADEDEE